MTKLKQRQFQPSTDGTLSSNSDNLTPSEKAVKTYVDGKASGLVTTAHTHSKLVASDGAPDPAAYCDADGWLQSLYGVWVTRASAGFSVFDGQQYLDGGAEGGAANTGGALVFRGHDGSNTRVWAYIRGMKENASSGNYASYISFGTRQNGQSVREVARIDSGGRLTVPDQPMFHAYLSSSVSNVTGDGTTWYKVPFASTFTNIGSNFSTSTNQFTAPVSGVYVFSAAVLLTNYQSTNTRALLGVLAAGRYHYVQSMHPYSILGAGFIQLSGTVIVYMSSGHTAECRLVGFGTSNNIGVYGDSGGGFTYFMGALLR